MQFKNQWAYLITIILLSAALLVGNRFDARWAGGDGYQKHQEAVSGDMSWQRGEVISSADVKLFTLGDSVIHLDENTEVKLIDGREDQEAVQLIQGRVYVDGTMDILIREIDVFIAEHGSVVHYSWLDEIDVMLFDQKSVIITPAFPLFAADIDATMIKMNTLTYDYTELEFSLENSSAKDFYETVLD